MVNLRRAAQRGFLSLIVLSVLNISGEAGAASVETPLSRSKLRVAWSAPTMTSGIPVWIAEDKGFFNKNGLDVELKHIASSYFFHTNKAESVKIAQKYIRLREGTGYLGNTYDLIVSSEGLLPRKPYPTEESIANILAELPVDQKGKAKPGDFIDIRILRDLDRSGFIDGLYSSQKDR